MRFLIIPACVALVRQRPVPQTQPDIQGVVAIQVALDRAGFSTGVIDGHMGVNTTRAMDAFRRANGRDPEPMDQPVVEYYITEEDAAGPFQPEIPADLMEQSKLSALSYRSVVELLAERFHTTPQLLKTLNPSPAFAAGDTINVPNVDPFFIPATPANTTVHASPADAPAATATSGQQNRNQKPSEAATPLPPVVVTVSRSNSALTVTSPDGRALMFAPVTTGSDHDPLPLGEWKVTGVLFNPEFHYNPELFWDASPSHTAATIPAGPNGPVGIAWIDLSKEHYGLHGAPEPSQIGRTQSHGCVRLTNWDVLRLAR